MVPARVFCVAYGAMTLKKRLSVHRAQSRPELPDLVVYLAHLASRIAGRKLLHTRLQNPFAL